MLNCLATWSRFFPADGLCATIGLRGLALPLCLPPPPPLLCVKTGSGGLTLPLQEPMLPGLAASWQHHSLPPHAGIGSQWASTSPPHPSAHWDWVLGACHCLHPTLGLGPGVQGHPNPAQPCMLDLGTRSRAQDSQRVLKFGGGGAVLLLSHHQISGPMGIHTGQLTCHHGLDPALA